ncbi:uncharacterized protein LOC131008485 [Salvia miltiorrhiza]|uniref:uncharacterized protein LOC131008485 n=1 Tax=Salvia miltiorrhiza TaxID=226208 RepID=UPI0025AD9B5E|nr:uncharacterized protein LOC131008485 [Salvia miltiorrhiza]
MEHFFSKKRRGESSCHSITPFIGANVEANVEAETNSKEYVRDPGLRKPIEEFDISIQDQVRREYWSMGPCQVVGHSYPKTEFGNQLRSFQDVWYQKFVWLEYSVAKDVCFCFWCYLFKPQDKASRYRADAFTKTGFSNWKKALVKFAEYVGNTDSCHNNARIQIEAFKDQRHSMATMFRSNTRELDVAYRARLTASLDVSCFLLKQGMPFRGNDESTSSSNRGNFLELLHWYSDHNDVVSKVLDSNALVFTMLVDEARDVSLKEQMGIVLKYVNDKGCVIERFIGIVHVVDTCSHSLKDALSALFVKHGLSLSKLRGQGYDGASNVRVNTIGASCKRKDQLRMLEHERLVKELNDEVRISGKGQNQDTSLARPGNTRWGSHYLTLLRLCAMWPSVEKVLENIRDETTNSEVRSTARGLLRKMNDFEFVFVMHLMKYLLGITNKLSYALQRRDQNIVQAMTLIDAVKSQLHDFRNTGWEIICDEVNRFYEVNAISLIDMEDTITRTGYKRQSITNDHYYCVEIFTEVVDLIIQEMNNRFSEASTDLLRCMACLDPRDSFSQFDINQLMRFTTWYPEDFSAATTFVERTFSAMKLVKSDLRNRMQDEWMNDNLIVYIEKDIFSTIDNEKILQRFQSMSARRNQLSSLSQTETTSSPKLLCSSSSALPALLSQLWFPSSVIQLWSPSSTIQLWPPSSAIPTLVSQLCYPALASQLCSLALLSQLCYPALVSSSAIPALLSSSGLPALLSSSGLPALPCSTSSALLYQLCPTLPALPCYPFTHASQQEQLSAAPAAIGPTQSRFNTSLVP